ncbi:MAG TPA: hypothetical protein VK472_01550 [Allosphingosinicella sp.]|nr:hypothetical protein [Allosphingosinicella sp.]
MPDAWFDFASQMVATIFGGAIVIVTTLLGRRHQDRLEAERRRHEAALEAEKQRERNAALFAAIFTIRKFLMRTLNELEATSSVSRARASFQTALTNFSTIIEKSPPDTEFVMNANYEISLALGELVAVLQGSCAAEELNDRTERLRMALEHLAMESGPSLSFTSQEDIVGYIAAE